MSSAACSSCSVSHWWPWACWSASRAAACKARRLPGDIYVHGRNSSFFYFPVTTCILLSALLSLVLWILRR